MNKTFGTNVAFTILIVFLFIGAMQGPHSNPLPSGMFDFENGNNSADFVKDTSNDDSVVVNDFEKMKQPEKVEHNIDRTTAMSYTQTKPISGTEMLALTKVKKINEHLNKKKKIVIYVNKGSDRDIQAFNREFTKTRTRLSSDPKYVFIPLETLWDLNQDDSEIKNSHDRVIYNLKKECGLFCVLDTEKEQMLKLKGSNVNKKSAEIVDVILNSL